jgi:hypothetical protein
MSETLVTTEQGPSDGLKCNNCNSILPSNALFCGVCGELLDESAGKIQWPWLWPAIIILSAIAAGLVTFVFTGTVLRPIIVMWFLFVCPGMAVVRFFRLSEHVVKWTLALALSFAIDGIVAGIVLYAGRWSPAGILGILIGLSLGGAIMQFAYMRPTTTSLPKQPSNVRSMKFSPVLIIICILLISTLVGTSLWAYAAYRSVNTVLPPKTASVSTARITSAVDIVIVMDNVSHISNSDPRGDRYSAAQLFVNLAPIGDRIGVVSITGSPTPRKILDLQDLRNSSDKELINSKLSSNFFGPVDANPTAYFTPALQAAGDMLGLAPRTDLKYAIIFTDAVALSGDQNACPASPDSFHNWFCEVGTLEQQGISVVLFGFTTPGSEADLLPTTQYIGAHGGVVLQVSDGAGLVQYLTQVYDELLMRNH